LSKSGYTPNHLKKQKPAACDMSTIAFYFLLQVSKYTGHGTSEENCHTKQFRTRDITFFSMPMRQHHPQHSTSPHSLHHDHHRHA
jgi:hypothetical protein